MPNYDFKSLSPYDFQDLVRDLLQKELGITLECFTAGRDGGIDLCYNEGSKLMILVQAKNYPDSRYSKLKSDLKNKEFDKVKRLSPKRYIITTSVGLTPRNKSEIKNIFYPYISSTKDIFGKSDLNNLLGKFPDIEVQNFKLWITSTAVMDKFIHNRLYSISNMELSELKKKLKYFVQNKNFHIAKKLLEQQHICIIAGIPGIGKTMLAQALILGYVREGYELIKISTNVSEAFDVYSENKNQIFYYDDFLGQTSLETKLGKNEEQNLLRLITEVNRSTNKRLILTTREYILNKAKTIYEKLDRSHCDYYKYSINISSYSDLDRAKILFNHLYFSGIPQKYIDSLCENRGYLDIINHENYNPRLIEIMTEQASMIAPKSEGYLNKFLEMLNNPADLWAHAFDYQISEYSRHLLLVLLTFPEPVLYEDLKLSFDVFDPLISAKYRISNDLQGFRNALKELDGNFIKIERSPSQLSIQFHNPSIRDFLENYIKHNSLIADYLCDSITFYSQCEYSCDFMGTSKLISAIARSFESNECCISKPWNPNHQTRNNQLWQRDEISLESRLSFAISICRKANNDDANKLINDLFKKCIERINSSKKINRDDFAEAIDYLIRIKFLLEEDTKEMLILIKPYFFKKYIDSLKDYINIINLIQIYPDIANEEELYDIKNNFLEYLEYYISELDHVWDYDSIITPDQYDINMDYLNKIASFFDIDISRGISRLIAIGKRLEEEAVEVMIDEDLAYESWRENREIKKLEEQIDSMFSKLKSN